jgi:hypothetical protein
METTVSKIFIKLDSVTATDNQTSPAHHHETKIHGDQKETIATKKTTFFIALFIVVAKSRWEYR